MARFLRHQLLFYFSLRRTLGLAAAFVLLVVFFIWYGTPVFGANPHFTATPNSGAVQASSTVNIIAVDSSGRMYLGGLFTKINGTTRNYIARLLSDGTLDTTWNPNANNSVSAFAFGTSTLYVGGSFSTIGGQTRWGIAELNLTTASATAWDPSVSIFNDPADDPSSVNGIVINTSTVYIAGPFDGVHGLSTQRKGFAEVSLSTGVPTSWNPNTSAGAIGNALAISTSTIFAGGSFSSIGGQSRNNFAELSLSTASATAWNPNANNQVRAIAVSTSTLYAGGDFSAIASQTRRGIAEVSLPTASTTNWNPNGNVGAAAYSLSLTSSTVYIGGSFTSIGGQSRNRLAELDLGTASATVWNPNMGGQVNNILLSSSTFYVGGAFTTVGGASRTYFAQFDPFLIQFTNATSSGSESSTSVNLGITLNATTSWDVTASYAVAGGTATGGGTDYTLAPGTATVSAGNTTTSIAVTVADDSIAESNETIIVGLSSPDGAYLGNATTTTYTITDNDTAGVTLSSTSTAATEGGSTGNYTVMLTSQPTADVTMTATSTSADITLSTTTLVFTSSNWNATQTVTVTAVDDALVEGTEIAAITHSAASSDANYNNISIASTTVTITDNDSASSEGGGGRPNDLTPPVRSEGSPSGVLPAATATITLSLKTDDAAACKFSTAPNGPMTTAYNAMPFFFATTGGTFHTTSISGLQDSGFYAYYIRCQDNAGNNNVDDYQISFGIAGTDTSPPIPIVPAPTSTPPASTTTELFPTAPSTPPQPAIVSSPPLILIRALAPGTPGNDVFLLQEKLKAIGFFPEVTKTVPYFGPQTKKSVQAYQCARKIVCAGTPATTGYGRVGPKTRAALAKE